MAVGSGRPFTVEDRRNLGIRRPVGPEERKNLLKKKTKKKRAAPSNRNATNWFCLLDFVFSVVFVLFFFSNYFPDAEGHRPLAVEAKNEKKMKKNTHTHPTHTPELSGAWESKKKETLTSSTTMMMSGVVVDVE